MPQLALARSFWDAFDALEKPVKAGVRKAMVKFQQSTGILDATPVEDLSGDGGDDLGGYLSLLRGTRPHATGYPTQQAEITALVKQLSEWIGTGVKPSDIAVCARFNITLDNVDQALADAAIATVRLKDNPGADQDGVRLGTMHAMKGLEFRCVAVVGATASAVPFAREVTPPDVDRIQHDSDLLRERCLLFVACTRAREALWVSWGGQASPFLSQVASRAS